MLLHELGDDVDMDARMEVFQLLEYKYSSLILLSISYLGESEVSPDNNHVRISREEIIPDLQVLDLLEVDPGVVEVIKESPVVRPQEVLPPVVVQSGQL